MDKIFKAVGARKDSDGAFLVDPVTLVRNVILAAITIFGFAFGAGAYMSNTKALPERVNQIEKQQERSEAQLENVMAKLDSISIDVRELRAIAMRSRRAE